MGKASNCKCSCATVSHITRGEKIIFRWLHDHRTNGHQGYQRTLASSKQRFYWPGYQADIRRWCKYCPTCARKKPGKGPKRGRLKQDLPSKPLEKIAIDILGPLEETQRGNKYTMVICDYFTKRKEAFAIKNHEAFAVADVLVTEFICRYGIPYQIHTDQRA